MLKPTTKYEHFNHNHEMTDEHEIVDFGDGEFIANKKAVPLLKALADLGIRTRTHHADDEGGFVGIMLDEPISAEIRIAHEANSSRTKYNGLPELILKWYKPKG